jgi:hypothetical protein
LWSNYAEEASPTKKQDAGLASVDLNQSSLRWVDAVEKGLEEPSEQ